LKTLDGKVVGWTGRVTHSKKEGSKYKNTPESLVFSKGYFFFGLDHLDEKQVREKGLYLVEGITDIFPFLGQGMGNCACLGSTSLTNRHLDIIDRLDPEETTIVTDGDVPGVMGAIRNANRILAANEDARVRVVYLPIGQDPFDLFYTQGMDIKTYVRPHLQSPDIFMYSNLGVLAEAHMTNATTKRMLENFLANNAGHLAISKDDLNARLAKFGMEIEHLRKPTIPLEEDAKDAISFVLGRKK
jgi:hypothetical protein